MRPAQAPPPVPALRTVRNAVYLYFFLLGLSVAVWVARIPAIKHGLHLSDGTLGVALLAMPAGAVLGMPVNGWLVDRFGSAPMTRLGGVLLGITLVGPGLAASLGWLVAALLVFGAAMSLLDVAMNAHGVRVERAYGRPFMSSFHASYSIAGLAGAVIGGLCARAGTGVLPMLAVTAVPFVVVSWICGRLLTLDRAPATSDAIGEGSGNLNAIGDRAPRGITLTVVLFGFLGVCATLGEGAAADWSAVYLHDEMGSSQGFAPAAFAAFSIMMAVGRLLGDRLALRLGPVRLVRGCGLLAAAGLSAALVTTSQPVAVAGFGLMGAGLSCIVPQLFSAVGRADPARAGRLISRVAGISYVGIVGGPPLIGAAAERVGLPLALGIPVLLALVIVVMASVLVPYRQR